MRVDIRAVSKRYDGVSALRDISLSVEQGEFFFLLGPSGCGKTTLLRILAGFEQPDSGTILFDGEDASRKPPEKRNAGMVFQNYALWPHLSVRQNVAFGLEVRGISSSDRDRKVRELLATVRMEGFEDRKPTQLSGGQQQRVALARALVIEPELVLLDEPLSNLDARLRLEMRTEIREIIKSLGHTAVYVTHDQKEALAMADRCAILCEGQIEQAGSPRDLYEKPGNRFVAEFLGEANLLPGVVVDQSTVRLGPSGTVWQGSFQKPLDVGMEVLCCIRPEAWRIGGSSPPMANQIDGEVLSSVYLGEVTQHRIQLIGTEAQTVLVLELHQPPRPPGPVSLWVDPKDTVILA
jgi:iron(III) transport system ATP-binding protein